MLSLLVRLFCYHAPAKHYNAWFAKPFREMYLYIYPLQAPLLGRKKKKNNNKEKITDIEFESISLGTSNSSY